MEPCQYLQDGRCIAIGELCDEPPVSVSGDTCDKCSRANKGEPRSKNSVTAYAALKHLAQADQKKLAEKRKGLQDMMLGPQGNCGQSKPLHEGVRNLTLTSRQSPGDVMTMTAAVASLHQAYPGSFATSVSTPCMEIWDHNPLITQHNSDVDDAPSHIPMEYPLVNKSNTVNAPFLSGYVAFLESVLGLTIPLACNRPQLYLSDEEKQWISQVQEMVGGRSVRYWVVDAGVKSDFTAKQWPIEYYQEVVNRTRHLVEWVQVGSNEHDHPRLDNVIDLRGETPGRKFIRLVYHSDGGLGPVTYLQHLCAAWEKPYLCLLGGREPVTWVSYPFQHTLHSIGQLDCCRHGACWKSRVTPLGDGDEKDNVLCSQPVISGTRAVGRCMQMITPDEVVPLVMKHIRRQ